MSTSLHPVDHIETSSCKFVNKSSSSSNKPRHSILKCKKNILHHRCHKELKKKLKKYRLRRNGEEDPEVLDVSNILISSLKIKSPDNRANSGTLESPFHDELKPKNYLFKMGRRKQFLTESESCNVVIANDKVIKITKHLKEESGNINKDSKSETDINSGNYSSSTKENDKQHTNAFKLLMESRNKSIGSNSPGKEKVLEECKDHEVIEKKSNKAKRTLLLQKMAEAKGSLKKKELEEHQEEVVKMKMEKRAERLKSLILKKQPKSTNKIIKSDTVENKPTKAHPINGKGEIYKNHKLHLVDLFQESTKAEIKTKSKCVTEEDKMFLRKLSPSLKKKENMLCYFKKIEKEDHVIDETEDNAIIKVKLVSKSKKKMKKRKLSLNKELNDDLKNTNTGNTSSVEINQDSIVTVGDMIPNQSPNTLNENMSMNEIHQDCSLLVNNNKESVIDVMRPRRNIKRPAKYIDEVLLSSSEDELHIFTPKKKRHLKSEEDPGNKVINHQINEVKTEPKDASDKSNKNLKSGSNKQPKLYLKFTKQSKGIDVAKCNHNMELDQQIKPVKLAPIFTAKSHLDTAALEAKQRFLSSGVPDKLKKVIEKKNNRNVLCNSFKAVVHIQQNDHSSLVKPSESVYDVTDSNDDCVYHEESKDLFMNILNHRNSRNSRLENTNHISSYETKIVLQGIKNNYPKFPVYRTYRMLKDKSKGVYKDNSFLDLDNSVEVIDGIVDVSVESPDQLSWTEKYKPMSSKEIIGNFETTKELKKWLISWTENETRITKYNKNGSDSSDFYNSDTDSKDSMKATNNLLIINGPVGSGKTSIVYAVAAELAIKVLEVNASSKRTGKIMLQDLQEATQSHKVNRGKSSSQECSQKLQEFVDVDVLAKPKKRGRPKKALSSKKLELTPGNESSSQSQASQDVSRTCMSLILIDDADIVFEQDDGFCSAIVQLVHSSKRPVILITSSTTCPHLQRFLHSSKVISTRPLLPRMLGTWLDIMCLVENNWCGSGIGAQYLNYFQGDIRKTINFLQFYFAKDSSANNAASQCSDFSKMLSPEEENSSMSWADREAVEEFRENYKSQHLLDAKDNLMHFQFPTNLFYLWWNIPNLLSASIYNNESEKCKDVICFKQTKKSLEMQLISNVLDTVSISDYFRKGPCVTDVTDSPWLSFEQDSVSEQENLRDYNKYEIIADEISHDLVTRSIVYSQEILGLDNDNSLQFPGMDVKRDKDKITSRHKNLTNYLNSSASLDRRALALDYWSGCRSICRAEKSKTETHTKRKNRYCHYLKSLNVLCSNNCFDNLGNSLCLRKEN